MIKKEENIPLSTEASSSRVITELRLLNEKLPAYKAWTNFHHYVTKIILRQYNFPIFMLLFCGVKPWKNVIVINNFPKDFCECSAQQRRQQPKQKCYINIRDKSFIEYSLNFNTRIPNHVLTHGKFRKLQIISVE